MANGSYPPQLNPGLFLPTTFIYDPSVIYSLEVTSPEFKEFLVRLTQSINNVALAANLKDTGYYSTSEIANGQAWFPDPALTSSTANTPVYRQVFRKVIDFGALPGGGPYPQTKTVAHNIAPVAPFHWTRIYGAATQTGTLVGIPLPYVDVVNELDEVELFVDATNVTIIVNDDFSTYNAYVVLEYIKQ